MFKISISNIYSLSLLLFFLALGACKSIKPDRPPMAIQEDPPLALSQVNIPIVIPLSYLEENLNKDWSSKLFAEKGLSLGSGLFADLDIDRTGKISLQGADNNTIKVRVPMNLKGDLKIEKKVFGQVLSTNFPFNESMSPVISFIPEIGRNWDLNIKNLNIENWGRSMKYNLLGFEIDLDPLVRNQLKKVLDNQLSAANLTRLDFKHMAQETWEAFSEPYTVEQEGMQVHFYSVPSRLKVNEEITLDQKLILYLGIEGEMFSKIGNKPLISPSTLPNIYYNDNKENILDLTMPLILKHEDLDVYLNKEISGKQIRTDSKTVLVPSNLKSQQYGDKTLIGMDFIAIRNGESEIKGKMYFAGKPVFDEDKEALKFEDVEFDVKTGNLPAKLGIKSKKRKIQNQIQKMAVLPIGSLLNEARLEMQKQGYFETDFATFRVKNPDLQVEGIYNTAEDIRLYLRTKGQMDVRLKNFK